MLQRLSANNTHLYPGALLRSAEADAQPRLSAGDEVLVEFSDGICASGRVLQADAQAIALQMPSYRTRRGTQVAARTWHLAPGDEPGLFHVRKRLPAD